MVKIMRRLLILSFFLILGLYSFGILKPLYDGKLSNGELYAIGWHDYGNCNGDDYLMCSKTGNKYTPCVIQAKECRSGYAVATAYTNGNDGCVLTWWRWECQDRGFELWSFDDEPKYITTWKEEINNNREKFDKLTSFKSKLGEVSPFSGEANAMQYADQWQSSLVTPSFYEEDDYRVSESSNSCPLRKLAKPDNVVIMAISIYESRGNYAQDYNQDYYKTTIEPSLLGPRQQPTRYVDVLPSNDFNKNNQSVILVLTAHTPVNWRIDSRIQNIVAVILSGYAEQQVSNISARIPVISSFYRSSEFRLVSGPAANYLHLGDFSECAQDGYFGYSETNDIRYSNFNRLIRNLTGKPIKYMYSDYGRSYVSLPNEVYK